MRVSQLTAGILVIVLIVLWSITAVTLADFLPDHGLVEAVFFIAAGLGWIWPAATIVGWAARKDQEDRERGTSSQKGGSPRG